MTKPLCYAPWISLLRKNKKGYAPCCVSERREFDSFDEYQNSEWLNDIKDKMKKNEWHSSCSYCQYREEKGIETDISMYDRYYNKMNENFEDIEFPPYIDIRYSNTCNLKCRMCSPSSSSKIENEYDKDKELYTEFYGPFYKNKIVEGFDFTGKHIKKIKVLGGEPTVDTELHRFLRDMIKNNTVEKISFTTNGTNLNEHFMKILEPIKEISVTFSVDATGRTYEYIRTNSKWEIVNNNINYAFEKMGFDSIRFNVVMTPWVAFNITILFDWFASFKAKGYNFKVHYDDSDDAHTSLSCLTKEHLACMKQSIVEWIEINPRHEPIYGDAIKIVKNVVNNDKNRKDFIRYSAYLDRIRNTNIVDLDVRFKEYT